MVCSGSIRTKLDKNGTPEGSCQEKSENMKTDFLIPVSCHPMSLCYDKQIKLEDNDAFDQLTQGKLTIRRKRDLSFPAVGYDAFQSSQ